MITAEQLIDQLPLELAARLQADEYFSDIPVVVAEKGNIRREMERMQAVVTAKSGKLGAAVIVLQIVADDAYDEISQGPMKLFPSFQVIENVELNTGASGTRKSARAIARRIVKVVKPLRLGGLTTEFTVDKPGIEPGTIKNPDGSNLVSYLVNFRTLEADSDSTEQVASPTLAQVGPQMGISCATAGAAIWFTVDESFPADPAAVPGSTAMLYSGPIDVPVAGLIVRACAYASGMIASRVERAEIE